MSDESRLEEQMIQEAIQLDAEKRKTPQPTEQQPVENKPVDVPLTVEPTQVATPQETAQQENFRYLREERERLEKKLDQERREKEELIKYMQQVQQQQQHPELVEEEIQLAPDEFTEGKHFNKHQQQMKLRLDRETKARQESEKRMYEMMVQQQLMLEIPDYRQVFTNENLDKLEKMYPDMAKSILANPDAYSKRKATIDAIRAFVIPAKKNELKEIELKAQTEKVNKNFNKPIPTSSTSSSPLSKANAFSDGTLTEERKTELFEDWHKKTTASYNFKR